MTIDIYAADEQHDHEIDLERWTKLALGTLTDEGVRGLAEVSLIFADEVTIADLNQQFMGKSGPTDVLSFPIDGDPQPSGRVPDAGGSGPGEPPSPEIPQLIGDVVLCPAVAARNALDHLVSLDDEIALLVVHGILHLLGWDHAEDEEAERMEARERELLSRHYRSAA
ncbi:MAG: putative rRNA maturation factor YbeY [Acidimicrobiaceae bacterium]|nr:putative rRNA maturation factor YbeY [Acidimicrobiaceae bacterium]